MKDLFNAKLHMVQFKLLTNGATIPNKSTKGAAGYDITANKHCTLAAGERALVPTGWALQIPRGYYAEIRPRSGLAIKFGIDTLAGVIDSDYRGEVHVALINHSTKIDIEIQKGMRIAQLIFKQHESPNIMLVADLDETDRGNNGFGSTGT